MIDVLILGAGASGLASSILIKRNNPHLDVVILEKMKEVGKKVKATGNGRCNIGNLNLDKFLYNNPEFMEKVLEQVTIEKYKEFFMSLGIVLKEDEEGRLYPYCESAKQVVDILYNEARRLKVKVMTGTQVLNIKTNGNFKVITNNKEFEAKNLIIATGGATYKVFGTDGAMFDILKNLKITVRKSLPGLVPLKIKEELEGVRKEAQVKLYSSNKLVYLEVGEVQFRKNIISGIVIFNISSVITRNRYKDVVLELDLMMEYSECELYMLLKNIKELRQNDFIDIALSGLFNIVLLKFILDKAGITYEHKVMSLLTDEEIKSLTKTIKCLVFEPLGTSTLDDGQVTIGGVEIKEISDNFESKKIKNLYVLGEALDIDGLCGGYNLYFAFASAIINANNFK